MLTLGTLPPPPLNTRLSQPWIGIEDNIELETTWNLIFCELQLVNNVEQGIITWATSFKKSGFCVLLYRIAFWQGHQNNVVKNDPKSGTIRWVIVNRGDWLGSLANIKRTNKDAKIYVGRSATLHNLLCHAHTLCMSYVTNMFLLENSSVRSKQLLCFVQGQGQKTEQKHTYNKKLWQIS